MKPELVVIADQHGCGEYVLGSCTKLMRLAVLRTKWCKSIIRASDLVANSPDKVIYRMKGSIYKKQSVILGDDDLSVYDREIVLKIPISPS